MEQFGFAQKAFITSIGKLLLVKKNADDPFHPNEWEVPGGRMQFGENLDEHIKREVKEEVGLDIIPREPFAMWTWIQKKRGCNGEVSVTQVIAVGVLCEAINLTTYVSGRVEDDFLSDAEWVPINRVLEYKLIPDIIPAMRKFAELFK